MPGSHRNAEGAAGSAAMNRMHLIKRARAGEIAIIKVPFAVLVRGRWRRPVVKVICSDRDKLIRWGRARGIPAEWLHLSRCGMPHFDLWGRRAESLLRELECIEEFLQLLGEK